MARALKVFRTSTGFHDAYIAAPSRAAALRAWGSDRDLFARGAAEQIDDPALMAEPLAHPGTVIRKSRGSLAEQLAALPKDKPRRRHAAPIDSDDGEGVADRPEQPAPTERPKPRKPKPRPSRATLDRAEAAAEALDAEQKAALDALGDREAALRRERRALEAGQAKARDQAAAAIERAKTNYDAAIERWRSED